MAQENIDVTVRLHDQLSRPADRAERKIEDLDEAVEDLNASLWGAAASAKREEQALGALGRAAGKTKRETDGLGQSKKKSSAYAALWAGALGGVGTKLLTASKNTKGLGAALKILKLPAIITAVSLLAGMIAALGAAAFAAIAGLSPLVGTLGALPALVGGLGQAFAVFKVGMSGVGDAAAVLSDPTATAEELSAALKDLTPAARGMAIALAEAKEQAAGIKKTVQGGLLPGMESGLRSVMPLIPIVERNLGATAKVLGDATAGAGKFAGSLGGDVNRVMEQNTRIAGSFGRLMIPLVSILMNLMITAGPLAERFANALAVGAEKLAAMVAAGRESGRLEAFFNRAGDLAAAVWKVLGDITVGLFNMGKQAGGLADMMGGGIERAAAKFRAWTESVEGQNAIKKFFDDAIPVVRETTLLIGDLLKLFGGLASDSNGSLAPLLKQVREELLPALERLSSGIVAGLGPAVVDLATAFADFFAVLGYSPLIETVGIFADLARNAASLVGQVPGLGSFIAAILTMKLVFGGLMALGKMTGITALITSMVSSTGAIRVFTTTLFGSTAALNANGAAKTRTAAAGLLLRTSIGATIGFIGRMTAALFTKIGALTAATGRYIAYGASVAAGAVIHSVQMIPALLRTTAAYAAQGAVLVATTVKTVATTAATLAANAAMLVVRGAIVAWTAAQWLLNAALSMNPIGLVIAILALLVGALVVAWKNSETFRSIVIAAWTAIKTYIDIWWAGVSFVFNLLKTFVMETIPSAFRTMVNFVSERWDAFTGKIASGWNWVRDNIFGPMGRFVTETIPGWFGAAVGFVREKWDQLLDVVKKPIKIAFDFANDKIVDPLNGILSKFPGNLKIPGLPRLAEGGPLRGPGTGTSDSILGVNRRGVPTALVSNGEHVWTKREVDAAGGHGAVMRLRKAVLAGLPHHADGGAVDAHDDKNIFQRGWGAVKDTASAVKGAAVDAWNGATGFAKDMLEKGARWAAERVLKPLQSAYQSRLPADQIPLNMARGALDKLFDAVLGKADENDAQRATANVGSGPRGPSTPNGRGGLGPAAARARDAVRSMFGFTGTIGGYAYRNIAGTNQLSKHALGKAIDVMTNSNMALGQRIADYFAGPGRGQYGVDNVIWNRRIHSGRGWGRYSGVSPHTDHPHIDFFDRGGVAEGTGLLAKMTASPERVLSPEMTQSFERLVRLLESNEPAVLARPLVSTPAVRSTGGGGGDAAAEGSALPPLHFHFPDGERDPSPEMREFILDVVRQADREAKERR